MQKMKMPEVGDHIILKNDNSTIECLIIYSEGYNRAINCKTGYALAIDDDESWESIPEMLSALMLKYTVYLNTD